MNSSGPSDLIKPRGTRSSLFAQRPGPSRLWRRMLAAANTLPLRTEEGIANPPELRTTRLAAHRTRAIIHTLLATALRGGDLFDLNRMVVRFASQTSAHLRQDVAKTGHTAHVTLGEAAPGAIEDYLCEKSDVSPWVFIQHDRMGAHPVADACRLRPIAAGTVATACVWDQVRSERFWRSALATLLSATDSFPHTPFAIGAHSVL